MGHWEIHPVEKVEAIDRRGSFQIGPSARVTSWPITKRDKILTSAGFAKPSSANYGKLVGTVQRIFKSPNKSGDVDVWVKTRAGTYLATIPEYYVASFNGNTQRLTLIRLRNFASINYSLQPSNATRSLYGLRNCFSTCALNFIKLSEADQAAHY
jgi:hypothetical protein